MTTTYEELVSRTQEQTLKAIEQAQEVSIQLASLTAGYWRQLPGDGALDALPKRVDAIERGFDFAARALELQKQYTLRLADAIGPQRQPAGS